LKKLNQYFILKFDSDRLREKNYKIKEISLTEARLNNEVVSISDCEMVRVLYRIRGREFSSYKLEKLLERKVRLTKRKNSSENRSELKTVLDQIDEMMFIEDIVSVSLSDKRHYKKILEKGGIRINGKLFVPFLFSAGMIRRNSGLFIDASLKDQIMEIFDNGRNKDKELVAAKYNSYLALYSSSTFPVTFPRIAVLPDLIWNKVKRVYFASYRGEGIDPLVVEKDVELEFNAFDGCGMVSDEMARQWSRDLDLDYTGSTFGVRSSFLKGMVVNFPFHKFAEEIAKSYIVKDAYGDDVDIREIDVITSPSMFKLHDSFESTDVYVSNCKRSGLGWGISKVNAKSEKAFCKTSYQFLQILRLNQEQVENLCKPTIDWLTHSSGGELASTLLYSLGEIHEFNKGWMNRLEPIYQSLLLENSLINDSHLVSKLDKSLSKKKNDAKKGNLYLNGNYQAVIPDLYLYCRHIFGMELIPFLKDGESFSNYWNEKGISRVAGIRSPIVYESEVIELNLRGDDETEKWFGQIKSGIVLPANGETMQFALAGGMDSDYDLLATINCKEILDGRTGGLPVVYDTEKAPKAKIIKENEQFLYDAHMRGFGTKVGFYTNVSSSLYALLYNFDEGSSEYNAIMQRLRWGRASQGLEIDRQKGLVTPKFPAHWSEYKKIDESMSDEEKEGIRFNNSISVKSRPRFFIYLYPHYLKKYKDEQLDYECKSMKRFGITFEELLNLPERTIDQQRLVDSYRRRTFFISNSSPMNLICNHVEKKLKETKTEKLKASRNFDYSVLLPKSYTKPLKRDLQKLRLLYAEYKSWKRSIAIEHSDAYDIGFSSTEQIARYINAKAYSTITNNLEELVSLVVYGCYELLGKQQSRSFMWTCFGKEITQVVKKNYGKKYVTLPMPSDTGSVTYLWEKFGMFNINIEEQ
jgi:hypothetical protein